MKVWPFIFMFADNFLLSFGDVNVKNLWMGHRDLIMQLPFMNCHFFFIPILILAFYWVKFYIQNIGVNIIVIHQLVNNSMLLMANKIPLKVLRKKCSNLGTQILTIFNQFSYYLMSLYSKNILQVNSNVSIIFRKYD